MYTEHISVIADIQTKESVLTDSNTRLQHISTKDVKHTHPAHHHRRPPSVKQINK